MDQKSFLAYYSWDQLKSNIKGGIKSKWINKSPEFIFEQFKSARQIPKNSRARYQN